MVQTVFRIGQEARVNELPIYGSTANAANIGMTSLSNGGWITTWASIDGDQRAIRQQVFNKFSEPTLGVDGDVVISSSQFHHYPTVASLKYGGWVVSWSTDGADTSNTYLQRYDGNADPIEDVDPYIGSTQASRQNDPTITALEDGGWIVSWSGSTGKGYQQRFLKNGNPATNTPVSVSSKGEIESSDPKISALPDEGWVVTWTGYDQDSSYNVYQQRYDKYGKAAFPQDVRVNTEIQGFQEDSDITVLSDGGWVVTWQSKDQDAFGGYGIYQQRYDSNGNALYKDGSGKPVDRLVNTTTAGDQESVKVTALVKGGWVVTWRGEKQSGLEYGIYQRAYDKNGQPASDEQLVSINTKPNEDTVDSSAIHEVTALADGSWVVGWSTWNDLSYRRELHQQRFQLNEAPTDAGLGGTVVKENAEAGQLVGMFSAYDPNSYQGDAFTYELLDNAGGRFEIIKGAWLVVAKGAVLDYEAATSQQIKVRVTDKDGLFHDQTYTINLIDMDDGTGTGGGGAGGGGSRVLAGDATANTLVGGIENNTIYGLGGNDVLTGGGGQDVFVFNTKLSKTNKLNKKANLDMITDFVVKDDKIWLSDTVFKNKELTKLGKKASEATPVKLKSIFFKNFDSKKKSLKKAQDKDDYVLYDKKSGALFFDVDAQGKKEAIQIATLSKSLSLSAADLFIV